VTNIANHLQLTASHFGSQTAINYNERKLSYDEVNGRSARLASWLGNKGLKIGDTVALQSANRVEILEIMYACFRAGLTVVPIHFKLQGSEVTYILSNSGAKLFFTDNVSETRLPDEIEIGGAQYEQMLATPRASCDPADVPSGHPAWLFYTSGTTGRPKGATLTHGNLEALVLGLLAEIDPAKLTDVFLHAGPMSHASGLCALAHVARGTRQVVLPAGKFVPEEFIEAISRFGVTTTFLVPTMISRLLDSAEQNREKLKTLRTIIYGGAPIAIPVLERAQAVFGDVFVQLYGQGEAPHVLSVLTKDDHRADKYPSWPTRLRSAGRPCIGAELRIVDDAGVSLPTGSVGEIVARGNIVMRGYWGDEVATAAALREGWLHTGDVGFIDKYGYLFLTDRKKELIISGGMNVYSREVEDVLHRHPAVDEAAVIGVPDSEWGEIVKAVVVLRPSHEATEVELIEFCRQYLATYKKPKVVKFVSELPKGATGKILKRALKEAIL
jgi:acyl-CoA synthetase (AMP-forming)/AMP-acid ligase II